MQSDHAQIIKRIEDRRKELRLSYQDLSEKVGLSKSSLQRYTTGAIKNLPLSKLNTLADALNTTPEYIMGWKKGDVVSLSPSAHRIARAYETAPERTRNAVEVVLEPYMDAVPPAPASHIYAAKPKPTVYLEEVSAELADPSRAVPLHLLPASAGSGEFLDSDDFELVDVGPEVPQSAHYGVRISGDSMEPDYPNGFIAWAKRTARVEEGQVGIFILNGEGYIKKWSRGRLVSLNPAYEPIIVRPDDDFSTRGLVVAVTENGYR